jgi:hypothetical protein
MRDNTKKVAIPIRKSNGSRHDLRISNCSFDKYPPALFVSPYFLSLYYPSCLGWPSRVAESQMADVDYALPPAYFPDAEPTPWNELPEYTRHRRRHSRAPRSVQEVKRTEHVFELLAGKTRPWATLKLRSNAKGPQQIPTFFQDAPIMGTLELDVEKEDAINNVYIQVSISFPLLLPLLILLSGNWPHSHRREAVLRLYLL